MPIANTAWVRCAAKTASISTKTVPVRKLQNMQSAWLNQATMAEIGQFSKLGLATQTGTTSVPLRHANARTERLAPAEKSDMKKPLKRHKDAIERLIMERLEGGPKNRARIAGNATNRADMPIHSRHSPRPHFWRKPPKFSRSHDIPPYPALSRPSLILSVK